MLSLKPRKRRQLRKQSLLRWLFYCLVLLLFYMLMSGGFFRSAQPIFIIPLAIAVAMHEREFSSAIFGAACGLMLDLACWNLFGMSSVWLMPCALGTSLLVTNLMRPNVINHFWMSAVACLLMAFMDYFFRYAIWDNPDAKVILTGYIIPSYLWAFLLSPPVYFLVKTISVKFREGEVGRAENTLHEPTED
ncbi:MAG: hypothetical protein FWH20_03885 [Oscillospiraceae bacterium]|nr:hypothetical protein [Oscillospiraceae bacterium]